MEPIDTTNIIPAELKAEYAKLLDNLAKGIRDPEAAKMACKRMDRMREENRKLFGEQDWIVETIRKMRDAHNGGYDFVNALKENRRWSGETPTDRMTDRRM